MHWLDDLPRKLPESMKEQLRGFATLQTAWDGCPHGPWLMRIAHAATHDRNARSDVHDLAMELAVDIQGELDAHQAQAKEDASDPTALALEYLVLELRAAADGDGPELTKHRATARPMQDFDATLDRWRKQVAIKVRARF